MVASLENRGTDNILKRGGEPTCKNIHGRVRNAGSAPTIVQTSLVGSHGSDGVVGRMTQKVTGLVRCLGITIRTATAVQLGPSHPILAGAVRHTVLLLTRFQVKTSSKTASALFAVCTRVLR